MTNLLLSLTVDSAHFKKYNWHDLELMRQTAIAQKYRSRLKKSFSNRESLLKELTSRRGVNMPAPLEIHINIIGGPHTWVPHDSPHREILIAAQNGENILVAVNGETYFGTVTGKYYIDTADQSWVLSLSMVQSGVPADIERIQKKLA